MMADTDNILELHDVSNSYDGSPLLRKVSFALGNVRNHIKGVGGGDNVNIVLVMHGPAVRSFVDIEAVDKVRNKVKALQDDGVKFEVCANTMNAIGVTLDEMLPGMISADNGGVVRMAELQSHGYLYIRP